LIQRSRVICLAGGLLLLAIFLSACGSPQVAQNWPGLTMAGDSVYIISGVPQQVYIVDAEEGVEKATFKPDGDFQGVLYWSPVTVAEDVAFVGFAESQTGNAGLYAFDAETGQELWHTQEGLVENLIIPAPVYAEGTVYFGDSDGKVYAVDVETRAIKVGWPFQAEEAIWASPLIAGQRLYVAAMDHHLYCLDAESGEMLWKTELEGAMAASPVLDETRNRLYVGTFDGRVYAIDAETGEAFQGSDFRAENWIWSQALLADGLVYVTSLDGRLYALDPDTGEVVPPFPYDSGETSSGPDVLRAAPIKAGEYVVVATESGRVVATSNAQQQWSWPSGVPEAEIYTTPVFSEGMIYVILVDGQLVKIDAESGGQRWVFKPEAEE
jgi:outer membrane protein assembly factor BamB